MSKKIAIITGATAGIGLATARKLAEAGYDLVLFARRQQRLDEVKSTLEATYGIKIWAVRNVYVPINEDVPGAIQRVFMQTLTLTINFGG